MARDELEATSVLVNNAGGQLSSAALAQIVVANKLKVSIWLVESLVFQLIPFHCSLSIERFSVSEKPMA